MCSPIYVALTDDNGDPIVGIVVDIKEGAVQDYNGYEGDDLWTIVDSLGDDYERPASMVPVIDVERLEALHHAAAAYREA